MEHLSLEIFNRESADSKYATLPEDTTISITDTSEIFASGDVWSQSFTLNVRANAHIFGTSGEIHGSRLHEQINNRRARLWVEGLPLYMGYLKLNDEVEVDEDGNVDLSFESGQKTFDKMIEGAKANQVPMMDDVLIGMALWQKRWSSYEVSLQAAAVLDNGRATEWSDVFWSVVPHTGTRGKTGVFSADGEEEGSSVQQYPRMVFPKGRFLIDNSINKEIVKNGQNVQVNNDSSVSIDCINTDNPYTEGDTGTHTYPFCNIALCYQRYDYISTDTNGIEKLDYSAEPVAQRGYEYMPANRVNSAPNFFVIYWIRALMKHLGIYIEENQMLDVQDLRRLFFVNTNCAYEEPAFLRTVSADSRFGKFKFNTSERLVAEYFGEKSTKKNITSYNRTINIDTENSGFTSTGFQASLSNPYHVQSSFIPSISHVKLRVKGIEQDSQLNKDTYESKNNYLHLAYATSECFPDADISNVLSAIQNGFGVRFLFNDNYQRVRIVLLRNIFRNTEVQQITCDLISENKTENCIRGFRMTYGNTEDTHFYYKGFADKLPQKTELWVDDSDKHDYSHWNLNADYSKLIQKVSAFDKTCYVTPNTGNAYIIKIDKNAKRYTELYPSVFEGAAFMDAVDGDCTGDEETIEQIEIGFTPAIMNDVNYNQVRTGDKKEGQGFALFVEETMRPRRPDLQDGKDYNAPDAYYDIDVLYARDSVASNMKSGGTVKPGEFSIKSDMFCSAKELNVDIKYYPSEQPGSAVSWAIRDMSIDGYINEGYRLYLQDNYEPNDGGVSPIETHDWGLTLGIMRGSGSDAYVDYSYDPDDGEGNETWDIVAGSSVTSHSDTCDSYGNEWYYNESTVQYTTPGDAMTAMASMWPNSNFDLTGRTSSNYLVGTTLLNIVDDKGDIHLLLLARAYINQAGPGNVAMQAYAKNLAGKNIAQMYAEDKSRWNILIEVDSSRERSDTLLALQRLAFGGGDAVTIDGGDNGISSRYGRFSLKLRAEKPNPYFDATQPESDTNQRYLEIANPNLRGRGLADQFYKEYSYWVRNARIVKKEVRMELAQLLAIDKTKRVTVGDVTGFVKKMQYSVSNQTGLGNVTMEIMYI